MAGADDRDVPGGAPDPGALAPLEAFAHALATDAGAEIVRAAGSRIEVRYKDRPRAGAVPSSAVSEVDRAVEAALRQRIAERHPDHGVIGEEVEEPAPARDWLWVLDPIDGTANFVNGYPLFACSIGLLWRGEPVVGAVWCAATHALRPGVYHARRGGPLRFDGEPYAGAPNPDVQRRLAGLPPRDAGRGRAVDHRVTGSAATEVAFVAAGLLRFTLLRRISIWDVAGGVVLAAAAGQPVWELVEEARRPLVRFEAPPGRTLRAWRGTLLVGDPGDEADEIRP